MASQALRRPGSWLQRLGLGVCGPGYERCQARSGPPCLLPVMLRDFGGWGGPSPFWAFDETRQVAPTRQEWSLGLILVLWVLETRKGQNE